MSVYVMRPPEAEVAARHVAAGPHFTIAHHARAGDGDGPLGAVVERVNPRGAPLRAWVTGLVDGRGLRSEVSPTALRMLAMADGDEVEVRSVHTGALAAG
jgi:hypothetical protein